MGERKRKRNKRSKVSKRKGYDPAFDLEKNRALLSEHIPYEADMLNGTFRLLSDGIDDPVTRNAVIESFCVHCRSLINFLRNDDDDVKVKEFAPRFDHLAVCQNKQYRALISDQIAHLCKRRKSANKDKIGPDLWLEMYEEIAKQILLFAEQIKDELKGAWPGWEPINSPERPPGEANTVLRTITSHYPTAR